MLHIKVSSRGSGKNIDLSQFLSNGGNEWQGCVFHVNEPIAEADAWLVLEDLDDDETPCRVNPRAVALLSSETSWEPGHYAETPGADAFLDQFPFISTCHDIYRDNVHAAPPYLPWMINANHGPSITSRHARDYAYFAALEDVEKSKDLSIFCSTQQRTAGHRMRLRFANQLKEYFGDRLDWFGNGVQSIPEKWDGIAPYRYTIVLENHALQNIVTEKLADAYLGLAYPIYWGAPNVRDIYPGAALKEINIADLSGSISTISSLIDSDVAEREKQSIIQGKTVALTSMHLYSRLAKLSRSLSEKPGETVMLHLSPFGAFTQRSQRHGRLDGFRRRFGSSS